jgi:hypothetical protein
MKTFCHINEYAPEQFDCLSAMILASDKITLHSLSGVVLDQARHARAFPFSNREVLDLVNAGHVQVSARESWFDKRHRSKHPWPGAVWVADLDDELSRLAQNEGAKDDVDRAPVFVLPEETGHTRALEQEEKRTKEYERAAELLESRAVPTGTLQKLAKLTKKSDKIKMILRDAYNHVDVQKRLRAQLPIEPEAATIRMTSIARTTVESSPKDPELREQCRMNEIIDLIRALQPVETFKDFLAQIDLVKPHRHELGSFLISDAPVMREALDQIQHGYSRPGVAEVLEFDLVVGAPALWHLAHALKDARMGRRDFLTLVGFGMTAIAGLDFTYNHLKRVQRELSLAPAAYQGPKLLFGVAYKNIWPTDLQVEKMIEFLQLRSSQFSGDA